MTVQQLPKGSAFFTTYHTYQSSLYSKSFSPLEVISKCWICVWTETTSTMFLLVSTKQMIFLLVSGRITMCKSLFTVCVFLHVNGHMKVCIWYKEDSKHNISVLITKSKVAIMEVTLSSEGTREGNQPCQRKIWSAT